MAFQMFWPGTRTMATQSKPRPASKTLRTRLGFSARRWARRETVFLLRDEEDRLPELRAREEELRLAEDFLLLLLLLERDCAIIEYNPSIALYIK